MCAERVCLCVRPFIISPPHGFLSLCPSFSSFYNCTGRSSCIWQDGGHMEKGGKRVEQEEKEEKVAAPTGGPPISQLWPAFTRPGCSQEIGSLRYIKGTPVGGTVSASVKHISTGSFPFLFYFFFNQSFGMRERSLQTKNVVKYGDGGISRENASSSGTSNPCCIFFNESVSSHVYI